MLVRTQPEKVSFQTHFLQEDYFVLCAYRFDKWFQCDMAHSSQKEEFAAKRIQYPCVPYFQEAQFACADDQFEYMLELAYYRHLNGITYEKFLNNELFTRPTNFDNPDPQSRIKYTY